MEDNELCVQMFALNTHVEPRSDYVGLSFASYSV